MLRADFKEGVLFSTYSTLIGAARGSKASRIDQIIKWCGGETFDGLLVFDECHRAKNFQVGEKEDASSKTSKYSTFPVTVLLHAFVTCIEPTHHECRVLTSPKSLFLAPPA